MQNTLFKNISIVNENKITCQDLYIKNGRIEKVSPSISVRENVKELNGEGLHLLPGVIDDQVHFRDPGLTHKADIYTESRAAIAGGVTSFMEMPNTIPNTLTLELLQDKYDIAEKKSLANYSFYMGVSNDNADEVIKTNSLKNDVCGVKIFMGSSTGNMLVDDEPTLHKIFSESELLIATHCEDEKIIAKNFENISKEKPQLTPADHARIRDERACLASSSFAVSLAKKYNSRLHILHISTAEEKNLFQNDIPLRDKRITSEVCVHHLHFTADDYDRLGYLIKCNPSIKGRLNREGLWEGLLNDQFDVIATDHAPHLMSEKQPPYGQAQSGLPLVQHSLLLMLHYYNEGKISLEKIAEKMSHAVADCFLIKDRGYIREGYFADLAIIDLNAPFTVSPKNIYYKCGWSPLNNFTFNASVVQTYVNGNQVYNKGRFYEEFRGQRLRFTR